MFDFSTVRYYCFQHCQILLLSPDIRIKLVWIYCKLPLHTFVIIFLTTTLVKNWKMGEVLKFKLNLNLRTFWETFDFWGYHRFSLGFQKKWQIGFIFFQSSLKKQRFFNCYLSKYRKLVYRPDKLKFILVCIFPNKAHTIVQRTPHRNLLFLIFRKKRQSHYITLQSDPHTECELGSVQQVQEKGSVRSTKKPTQRTWVL